MQTQGPCLTQQIKHDMHRAMKMRDKARLAVIRLVQAAIKQREIETRVDLSDSQVVTVLHNMLKQRRDALAQYQAAKRPDLARQETFEIQIIQGYLPEPMSDFELDQLIQQAMVASQAQTIADMGKVMALLRLKTQGRADLSKVSQRVKARLTR